MKWRTVCLTGRLEVTLLAEIYMGWCLKTRWFDTTLCFLRSLAGPLLTWLHPDSTMSRLVCFKSYLMYIFINQSVCLSVWLMCISTIWIRATKSCITAFMLGCRNYVRFKRFIVFLWLNTLRDWLLTFDNCTCGYNTKRYAVVTCHSSDVIDRHGCSLIQANDRGFNCHWHR